MPNLVDHSYVLSGDLGVMKMTLEHDSNRVYACEIVDFEDGKIKRARGVLCRAFRSAGVACTVGRKDVAGGPIH